MAWLQSSFTNHQVLGESVGSSQRKGYKLGSLNKNTDPDKSDTPLLQESPCLSPDKTKGSSDWFEDDFSAAPKKQSTLGKSSFLTSSFFDRSSISLKPKQLAGSRETSQSATAQMGKVKENSKLLSGEKNKIPLCDDEYEDESDDEWCVPHTSGGYQKVKSGAD